MKNIVAFFGHDRLGTGCTNKRSSNEMLSVEDERLFLKHFNV